MEKLFKYIIVFFAINLAVSTYANEDKSALIISGGISLGVYEAGLNSVILHSYKNKNYGLPNLSVTTGSSAGAINALASAISYCQTNNNQHTEYATNNIFRDIWIEVGMQTLLPHDNSEYDKLELKTIDGQNEIIEDSILSRWVFNKSINEIRNTVQKGRFTKGCRVLIGIMVTLGKPKINELKLINGKDVDIQEQSFAIPILLEVDKNGKAKFKNPDVENFLNISKKNIKRKFILLPEQNGHISFDIIMRAVLASSAFPIAFGQIEMKYCYPKSSKETQSNVCPKGYILSKKKEFIDGGYFNNVPIGLAAELFNIIDYGEKHTQSIENYIFLDPGNTDKKRKSKSSGDGKRFSIRNQLKNILPGIGTLRNKDMYGDFYTYFIGNKNRFRKYHPTKRSPYLTGTFLGAFGAFFDPLFREYDYAAGVYDGLVFSASQVCNLKKDSSDKCTSSQFLSLYNDFLGKSTSDEKLNDLRSLVGSFLYTDFSESTNRPEWRKVAYSLYSLYSKNYSSGIHIIKKTIDKDEINDFKKFISALKKDDSNKLKVSSNLRYMMNNPNHWQNTLIKRLLGRMLLLEKKNEGDDEKTIAFAYAMIPDDVTASRDLGGGRFPDEKDTLYKLIPDQLGLDATQTGLTLGWSWIPEKRTFGTKNGYYEIDATFHKQIKDISENQIDFFSIGLGQRITRSDYLWSSWGAGLNINKDIFGSLDDDLHLGGDINFGFLSEKIRLSIGSRDILSNYDGEDWSVRLMITNIDELLWAVKDRRFPEKKK